MNELVENLASRKTFSELTETEREAVLAEMSPEAYENLRALLLAAPALDTGPLPPAALRARLLDRMAATAPHRSTSGVLALCMPVWQAAAVLAIAVAAVWFLKAPVVQEVAVPVVRIQNDTFFREKVVWRERVVFREKAAPQENPALVIALPEPFFPREPAVPEIPSALFEQAPAGTSLRDEPALMDFFVQTK